MFIGPGVKINPGVGVTALPPDPVYIMRILDSEGGSVITTCNEGDEIWIEVEWAYLTVPSGEGSYLQLGGASITAQDVYGPGPIDSTDPIPWGSDQNIPGFSPLGGTTGSPALVNADRLTEGNETLTWSWYVNGQVVASTSVTIVDTSINPTYTLSTAGDVTSINEGSALTFNVATTEVDDGTTLWWATGIGGTNMSFGRLSPTSGGSVTVASNAASFSITVSADNLTSPDQQNYVVRLYKNGPGGGGGVEVDDIEINVNDTSQTPPAHGSAVFNQPENDYLKISGPGTGIVKIGPDSNGQDYAGGSTIFSIPFFADGVVETIPILNGGGWTITFKNGQTRTISSVATGYNGAVTYSLNLDSPLYAGANEVFPAVIKSSDFVDRPWNLGTTWTIEFWIYMNYGSNDNTHIQGGIWGLLNQTGWGATNSINIGLASGYLQVAGISSSAQYRTFIEPTPQQWVHVAIVNNAGTQSVYYDGIKQVQVNSDSGNGNYSDSTSPLYIGSLNSGNSFDGKLTNLRITDTAVYTANFNPPTVLPTRITNHTRLLWTPTDAALATDTSDDPHTITNTGVTYSSSYPATNNTVGSALFNGSTLRYYKVAGGSHFQLGTTWTIEWWQKSVDNTTVLNGKLYAVMGQDPDGGRIDIYYQDGSLKVQNGQALCAEPPAGQWVHVALVNNAGSGTVYYNGVAQSASGNFGNYGQTLDLYIGKRGSIPYQPFNGKLTNIRITDTAVYTSNFVPSLTPTLIAGNTKLLLVPNADTINGVDTGDLALAVSSSGIRYSSDYPS